MQRQKENEKNDGSWWGVAAGIGAIVGLAGLTYYAGASAVEEERKVSSRIQEQNRTKAENKDKSLAVLGHYNENSDEEDDVDDEYDSEIREAVVYLFTSVTDELPLATNAAYHHWSIVVFFDDKAYRTLDGYNDGHGRMCARYKKIRPVQFNHVIKLGHVTLSPCALRLCAKKNLLNGTPFNFGENNCQNWALALAKALGVDIFDELRKIDRVPNGLAVIGGMCSALLGSFTRSSKQSS